MRTLLKQKLDKCKSIENLSDVDVSRFLNGDTPETLKGKCLISCLQEAVGLVRIHYFSGKYRQKLKKIFILLNQCHFHNCQIQDGQVQPAAGFELGKMLFGDNENVVSAIKKVQDECASISDADRCEMAFKRMSCAKETVKKYGLVPPREMI